MNNINKKYTIGQAAEILGVNVATLRNWEKSGRLVPVRSGGGHRYYMLEDIEDYLRNQDVFKLATKWAHAEQGSKALKNFYCPSNDIFRARLESFNRELKADLGGHEAYSLIGLVVGEIGNNSFDHNLGNWHDIPGIFFAYNLHSKQIALADRGQGVLHTLKRVKPELDNHQEALRVAFTEIISGRAPEARGNGLKAVKNVITGQNMELIFQSGNARLKLKRSDIHLNIREIKRGIAGCLALISYNY